MSNQHSRSNLRLSLCGDPSSLSRLQQPSPSVRSYLTRTVLRKEQHRNRWTPPHDRTRQPTDGAKGGGTIKGHEETWHKLTTMHWTTSPKKCTYPRKGREGMRRRPTTEPKGMLPHHHDYPHERKDLALSAEKTGTSPGTVGRRGPATSTVTVLLLRKDSVACKRSRGTWLEREEIWRKGFATQA